VTGDKNAKAPKNFVFRGLIIKKNIKSQPSNLIHHPCVERFLSIAALTKLTKSGCGFITVDLYSGWNWAAKKYG
jgi:hypothetical protein